jgi:hypothetical protein
VDKHKKEVLGRLIENDFLVGCFAMMLWLMGVANGNVLFAFLGWCVGSMPIYFWKTRKSNVPDETIR